ncbi:MAG: TSUP family transporter, partial [Cruoricaptor ignavus]|nr:TSUP family transporter [Cruoricaptor ignavus]
FLNLENLKFLILGGGNEALESLKTLVGNYPETEISLVAPQVSEEIKTFVDKKENIKIYERRFFEYDFYNSQIAVVADEQVQFYSEIIDIVQKKNILLSIYNKPDLSDFQIETLFNEKKNIQEIPPQEEQKYKWQYQHEAKKYRRLVIYLSLSFAAFFLGIAFDKYFSLQDAQVFVENIPTEFYYFVAIGFVAQLIDGAVGLGYGLTCATFMLAFGVKLPAISGSIHTAEMFSSAMSGYSHYKFGNVNKKMLFWLALPGVLGAVSGSLLLIYLGNEYEHIAKMILAGYTIIMGIRLVALALKKVIAKKKTKAIGRLGFLGGFMDAFGGGGWGPIVTSTLLSKGRTPKYVIGTVSLAEFFVTLSAAIVFFSSLGVSHLEIIIGLITGGVIAAPLAAKLAGKLPQRTALLLVAALLIISSTRIIIKLF